MRTIYYDDLVDKLKSLPVAKSNNNHIIIRCPYCGDSRKHQDHGHLYVSMELPVFRCVRCDASGNIKKLMRDIFGSSLFFKDIIRPEYLENISFKEKVITDNKVLDKSFIDIKDKNNFGIKHDITENYMKNRLKVDKIPNFINERIIDDLDLKSYFLSISNFKDNDYMKNEIMNNYFGFISDRKTYINFRRIDNNSKYRYVKVRLTDGYYTDFLSFKNEQYSQSRRYPYITIGEGIFDVLNSLLHTRNINDSLYYISCDKSQTKIPHYISLFYNIFYANYYILADSSEDVDIRKLYNYFVKNKKNKGCMNQVKIIKNKIGKDFGDINPDEELELEFY